MKRTVSELLADIDAKQREAQRLKTMLLDYDNIAHALGVPMSKLKLIKKPISAFELIAYVGGVHAKTFTQSALEHLRAKNRRILSRSKGF